MSNQRHKKNEHTTVEWRVESETLEDEFGNDEKAAREWLARCRANPDWEPVVLRRRTVTVTTSDWEDVDDAELAHRLPSEAKKADA